MSCLTVWHDLAASIDVLHIRVRHLGLDILNIAFEGWWLRRWMLCRVYRVAHGADIIPYLPPKVLEYEDVGPEIFITSTGRVLFNQKVSTR